MRQFFPVEELARDERFNTITMPRPDGRSAHRSFQPSAEQAAQQQPPRRPSRPRRHRRRQGADARHLRRRDPGARRRRPHLPRLRDQHDGDGTDRRRAVRAQARHGPAGWDEARHVEISVKLSDWMGTEIGQFAENTVLFEAACSNDPVLRLAGVNRALEGLAIDVFTTMKEFGDLAGDPYLEFCEDWMLADEVTHVKMGSDWLRKVTENDPERRKKALEFQSVVDKLFSYGGTRSDSEESPIGLARRFRELAGFTDDEVDEIAEVSLAALERAQGRSSRKAARERHERRGHERDRHTAEFNFVAYDAALIQRVAEELLDSLGLADRDRRHRGRRDHAARPHPRRDRRHDLDPCRERRVRRHQATPPAERGRHRDVARPRAAPRQGSAQRRVRRGPARRRADARAGRRVGDVLRRPARAARHRGQPAALALQLPQPSRLHRRSRRGVRPPLGRATA